MKAKKEKIAIAVGICAIVILVIFLVLMQVEQNKKLSDSSTYDTQMEGDKELSTRSTKAEEKIYIKSATVDGQVELANDSSRDIEINGYYFIVNGNDKVAISDNPTIQAHKTYEMNVSGYLNRDGKDIIALYSSEDVNTDSYLITNESQPVEFSVASGFYSEDFDLELNAAEGTTIYYTLDGTTPTAKSQKYEGPISISNASKNENVASAVQEISSITTYVPSDNVDKGTVVKAIAVDALGKASNVVTNTYFVSIGDKAMYQDIPVVSIVANHDDLFDYFDGMYVLGRTHEDDLAKETQSEINANYKEDRKAKASIEYYEGNKSLTYKTNGKISIVQDDMVDYTQKSLKVAVNGNEAGKGSSISDKLLDNNYFVLSNSVNDYAFKLRQYLANSLLQDTNEVVIDNTPCIVFINGEFWGMYQMKNEFNSSEVAAQTGLNKEDILTAVDGEVIEDTQKQYLYNNCYNYVIKHDMRYESSYNRASELMDMQSYADFICSKIYLADYSNNYKEYMWCSAKEGEYGKWHWALGDMENSIDSSELSTSSIDTFLRPAVVNNQFLNSLMRSEQFRKLIADTMNRMAKGSFSEENVDKALNDIQDKYAKTITNTYTRFAGAVTVDTFKQELDYIREFFEERPEYITGKYLEEYISK